MLGVERVGWGVLAMETRGKDSLVEGLKGGKLVTLSEMTSIAISIGWRRVAAKNFWASAEEALCSMMRRRQWVAADDERMLVEASCGVSAAVCYDGRLKKLLPHLAEQSKVVIVELLGDYKWQYWYVEQCTANDELLPSTPIVPHVHLNGLSASLEG